VLPARSFLSSSACSDTTTLTRRAANARHARHSSERHDATAVATLRCLKFRVFANSSALYTCRRTPRHGEIPAPSFFIANLSRPVTVS